jgi:TetR/AcrR family transcriptional repressor of nem operon
MKHNREGILLNAMYYVWKNGYYNSGIQDILKSSGIPKGTFYHLFESKEDFFVEIIDLYGGMLNTSLEEFYLDKRIPVLERLKNFYINQVELCSEEGFIRGCLISNLSLEVASMSKKIRKELTTHITNNLNLLEKCMLEAENKGQLNDYFTTLEAAELIQNNWFGAIVRSKGSGKTEPMEQFINLTFELLSAE